MVKPRGFVSQPRMEEDPMSEEEGSVINLPRVWESLNTPGSLPDTLPHYEKCFQGFWGTTNINSHDLYFEVRSPCFRLGFYLHKIRGNIICLSKRDMLKCWLSSSFFGVQTFCALRNGLGKAGKGLTLLLGCRSKGGYARWMAHNCNKFLDICERADKTYHPIGFSRFCDIIIKAHSLFGYVPWNTNYTIHITSCLFFKHFLFHYSWLFFKSDFYLLIQPSQPIIINFVE